MEATDEEVAQLQYFLDITTHRDFTVAGVSLRKLLARLERVEEALRTLRQPPERCLHEFDSGVSGLSHNDVITVFTCGKCGYSYWV